MKTCSHCKQEKELLEFFRQKSGDGYQTICKVCKARYQQEYRQRPMCDPVIARLLANWKVASLDDEA